MMQFTKATKTKAKLRLAVFGPSGSGKTYTSLRIAKGMGGKIALIDTERGSASKYADCFDFEVLELPDSGVETYISAIEAASKHDVLIIDSITHGWKSLCNYVEKVAQSQFRGNTWAAWSKGTPLQQRFIDALLNFNGHLIVTMRSKTEWALSETGSKTPTRVGLAPEQGKGIEYEFDLLMELSTDHIGTIIKDRTGRYQDKMITKPNEKLGEELIEWLNDGEERVVAKPKPQEATDMQKAAGEYIVSLGIDKDAFLAFKEECLKLNVDWAIVAMGAFALEVKTIEEVYAYLRKQFGAQKPTKKPKAQDSIEPQPNSEAQKTEGATASDDVESPFGSTLPDDEKQTDPSHIDTPAESQQEMHI